MRKLFIIFLILNSPAFSQEVGKAYFAGGCFWCMEESFEKKIGVIEVISGYSGGKTKNPTYEEVTYGNTGHFETVEIIYDKNKVSFKSLLDHFWVNIDPFDEYGQFCDRGDSYKPVIFTSNQEQNSDAKEIRKNISIALDIPLNQLKVDIIDSKTFWSAESYHQDFAVKNPLKYNFYRTSCGRDNRLKKVWGEYK